MKIAGFEIKRVNRIAELEKRMMTLEAQALRVTSLKELAAQASGQLTQPGDGQFPFGPSSPIQTLGTPREQMAGARRWQYLAGQNLVFTPRAGEQISFANLRNFARLYDIARICIQVRKEEIQGLEWAITSREKGREDEYAQDIASATEFFEKPDRRSTFDDWLALLLEDIFVIDAMTLHKQRTRDGKALYALRYVDGATIHPVIDEVGEIYGYQQIIYGVPRTCYVDPDYARLMPDADQIETLFPFSELIYRPRVQMPDSLYGFPPLEWIVVTTNQAMRKQISDLNHFTEGNTPEALAPMPEGTTIDQALQFNEDFNALLAGDPRARAGLHFLPGGIDPTKIKEFAPFSTETAWDEMLLKKTCAAFGISPQEIGFTAEINKATGEMQENVQSRRSVEPLTQFLESLFSDILKSDLKLPHLKFTFHVEGEKEDALKTAQADDIAIKNGSRTIDEVRSIRQYGKPFGIDRPFVMTTMGPVYLDAALSAAPLETEPVAAPATTAETPPAVDETMPATPAEPDAARVGPGRLFNAEELRARAREDGVSESAAADSEAQKALAQWKENSLKRVKAGKAPRLDFASAHIPAEMRDQLVQRLAKAKTAQEVRAAFEHPFGATLGKAVDNRRDAREPGRAEKEAAEKELERLLREFWKEQALRIEANLKTHAATVGKIARSTLRKSDPLGQLSLGAEFWKGEDALLTLRLLDFLRGSAQGSIALADAATVLKEKLILDTTLTNAEAEKWAREYAAQLVTKINATTRDSIREAVATWIATPDSTLGDLMDRLPFNKMRARLIAVTETTQAYAEGERLYTESLQEQYPGLEIVRLYYTNEDGLVCDDCAEMDGKEIEGEGDAPPRHPGCRCWTGRKVITEE